MELIRGLHNLRPRHRGCALTVGAFDGIHLGHRAVLDHLQTEARERGLASLVTVFEPLPREYFRPLEAPPRITNFRERLEALSATGVDRVLLLKFDSALRTMSADEFIKRVIVDGVGAQYVALGDDFRFGNRREGDFEYARDASGRYGYEVQKTPTFELEDTRVSSTRIRDELARGNFDKAEQLLGRPFTMKGRVEHGLKLGRELGCPTANIRLNRLRSPLSGVFVVRVEGPGMTGAVGVANVGTRPTVSDGIKANLEVHLLDQTIDLYGTVLEVRFLHKLREELKYDSLGLLQQAIANDITDARQWLANHSNP